MSDLEFDIIDELYFVNSFTDLRDKLHLQEGQLKFQLLNLIENEWVNYFEELDGLQNPAVADLSKKLNDMFFLASKQGLLAHNSR
ncbi:MAG: hypothetical protein ACKVOU_03000 [Cytophagales bacterium]